MAVGLAMPAGCGSSELPLDAKHDAGATFSHAGESHPYFRAPGGLVFRLSHLS
jgi:hypothetical protein